MSEFKERYPKTGCKWYLRQMDRAEYLDSLGHHAWQNKIITGEEWANYLVKKHRQRCKECQQLEAKNKEN